MDNYLVSWFGSWLVGWLVWLLVGWFCLWFGFDFANGLSYVSNKANKSLQYPNRVKARIRMGTGPPSRPHPFHQIYKTHH